MESDAARIKALWEQSRVPIILRRTKKGDKLRLRLPYAPDNRRWLKEQGKSSPIWVADRTFWELPKAWFHNVIEASLERFGQIYVVQPFRQQEKCSPSCMSALGHECECSCMGANHGSGNDGSWIEISDAFATRWGPHELACRLIRKKQHKDVTLEDTLG